jgi:sugar phosphate isomerase/epimerase
MIKLGVNSVLFNPHDLRTAMEHIKAAGYDGVEVSAIKPMCTHLDPDNWEPQVAGIKAMAEDIGLELLSMEHGGINERLPKTLEAAAALGIPVVNIGPGGAHGSEEDFERQTDLIAQAAEKAASLGVSVAVKAHVNSCIDNTPLTLRALEKIANPAFGVDMDPSHVYRNGEDPAEALAPILSRTKHIHIRDCKGRQQGPGDPCDQACGRGDINLYNYFRAMLAGGYDGPVCLEIIGAKDYTLAQQAIVAAESRGYMNAILKIMEMAKAAGCPESSKG